MTSADLVELVARVGPVLVFLLAITVVAEIADRAGVFDVAGHWATRAGRHRTLLLWLLFVLVAVACTVVLSLDTTAVLLTPVGLAVARQLDLSPVPFALSTLWLANTASLLLPVSNLTNLLALHRFEQLGLGHAGYVRLAALPALGAVLGTVVVLFLLHRRELTGRYLPDAPPEPHDRALLRASGAVCLVIGPLFAVGAEPAVVASVAAAVLAGRLPATHLLSRRLVRSGVLMLLLGIFQLAIALFALTALATAAPDASSFMRPAPLLIDGLTVRVPVSLAVAAGLAGAAGVLGTLVIQLNYPGPLGESG